MSSDYEKVVEFTKAAEQDITPVPTSFNKDETHFLVKMMLDEIMELMATVDEPHEAKYQMIKMITESKDLPKEKGEEYEIIASQVDALVDCLYYSLNGCAKKNIDFSSVFDVVHESNMSKRDIESGKFLKREDGKIIKPLGYKEANIKEEILRQITENSKI